MPANPVEQQDTIRLGPIRMLPGVRPINVITLFFTSFFGIAVMSFMNASAPILFDEILGIPQSEFGRLSGRLVFWHEVVVILCIAPIGAMSDRFGRRPLYALAFFLIGVGHFLYPLAENEDQLLMFRMVFAVGTASASAMPTASFLNELAITAGSSVGSSSRALARGSSPASRAIIAFVRRFWRYGR